MGATAKPMNTAGSWFDRAWRGLLLGTMTLFVVNIGLIIAAVVYLMTKALIKEAPAPPPPPTKNCPRCKEAIVVEATKCKFCTADI